MRPAYVGIYVEHSIIEQLVIKVLAERDGDRNGRSDQSAHTMICRVCLRPVAANSGRAKQINRDSKTGIGKAYSGYAGGRAFKQTAPVRVLPGNDHIETTQFAGECIGVSMQAIYRPSKQP